ncbi:MAG: hypothetical protein GY722_05015 [bacterium]|nr:hypothetical protein [bacterium]
MALLALAIVGASPRSSSYAVLDEVVISRGGNEVARGEAISPELQEDIVDFLEFYVPDLTDDFTSQGGKIAIGQVEGDSTATNDGRNIVIEPGRTFSTGMGSIFHEMAHVAAASDDGGVTACEHAVIYWAQFGFQADLLDYITVLEADTGKEIDNIPCDVFDTIRRRFEHYDLLCYQENGGGSNPGAPVPPLPTVNPGNCEE